MYTFVHICTHDFTHTHPRPPHRVGGGVVFCDLCLGNIFGYLKSKIFDVFRVLKGGNDFNQKQIITHFQK